VTQYQLIYTEAYLQRARKFFKRRRNLLPLYEKAMTLLEVDPFHPSLRLHKLEGRLKELHSISINLSYRVVIHFLIDGRDIVPVDIGDHSVYR
jgi:proteic killer suppression protein